ncbi:hypothetical protein J4475_04160 [Candidatus Woesearchaeota archaeon]|nr:hypothetical protein [Candidatus Woesearchaeota archaeon]
MVDVKQAAFVVAVAVLFASFIGLAHDALYDQPEYNQFCTDDYFRFGAYPAKIESTNCTYIVTEEERQCVKDEKTPVYDYNAQGCQLYRECSTCNQDFKAANETYSRNSFFIIGIIALAAIVAGMYLKYGFIGTGFLYGGILLLVYSNIRFIGELDKFVRVGLIFIELLLVIWIGYRRLEKK